MRINYHRKLAASIYHHAKNAGIIGILPYSKIKSKRKRGNRRVPLPFRGKRGRVGLTLKLDELLWPSMTFEVILIEIKYLRIHNISVHINFYQNRFTNESVRKNFLKFSDRRKDGVFLWVVEELTFLIKCQRT